MGLKKGLRAVKEAKEKADARGGGGGLRFFLKDGETAVTRFYGDFESEEDPVVYQFHYIKRLASGDRYQNCGENSDQPCVFDYQREHGDRGIGKGERALFFLRDTRKVHRLDQEVTLLKPGVSPPPPGKPAKPDDYYQTKYPPCSSPKRPCQWCKTGNQPTEQGHRYWELAVGFSDQLVTQQNELRNYCRCGAEDEDGNPTLYVTRYLCSGCNEEVEFYPEQGSPVAHCPSCRNVLPPLEEIACTACETPTRCSIQDFFFRVTRNGEGQDTGYNFEAIHPCKPPSDDELAEAAKNKPDWVSITAADPPEMQAALLGIMNPYGATPGHGATPYADDNTPEDYSDQVDYGPVGKPAPRAPAPRPPAPKAPVSPPAAPKAGGFKIPRLR